MQYQTSSENLQNDNIKAAEAAGDPSEREACGRQNRTGAFPVLKLLDGRCAVAVTFFDVPIISYKNK